MTEIDIFGRYEWRSASNGEGNGLSCHLRFHLRILDLFLYKRYILFIETRSPLTEGIQENNDWHI